MEKISKKEIMLIIVLLISLLAIYKLPKLLINKSEEELPEVNLKETKVSKSFAVMVQNESGTGYEEYTSEDNTWPGNGYIYKEAKCTDNKGSLVDNVVTFNDGKATLKTSKTLYCTLYFDALPKEIYIDFGGQNAYFKNEYSNKIKQIEFVNYIDINTAEASWDLSDTKNGTRAGSVMAWVKPIENDSDFYILYIGCTKEKIKTKTLEEAFYNMKSLETVHFNDMLDTSEMTSVDAVFGACTNLQSVDDITNWDVSSLTKAGGMFINSGLKSVDLSGWNKYFPIDLIFAHANLTEINLSNWDIRVNEFPSNAGLPEDSVFITWPATVEKIILNNTHFIIKDNSSNEYNFSYTGIFNSLKNLKEVYLNGATFDKALIDEFGIFQQCTNLVKVEMKNADISNLSSLYRMFYASSQLEEIDLTGTDTSSIRNFGYMFGNCTNIKTIHFDNLVRTKATSSSSYQYMFYNISRTATIYVPSKEISWIQSRLSESSRSSVTVIGV